MNWWKRFIELREEKGMLQKDVAKYLGVSRSTYAGYEAGTSEPNIERIKTLAKYYSCSIDYLIGATNKKNSNSDLIKEIIDITKKYQNDD